MLKAKITSNAGRRLLHIGQIGASIGQKRSFHRDEHYLRIRNRIGVRRTATHPIFRKSQQIL